MGGFKRKTISKIGLNALNYVDAVTGTKRQAPLSQELKTIFSDVKTEGRKKGYNRAAQEYEPVLAEVEWAYDEIVATIKKQGVFYRQTSEKILGVASKLNEENEEIKENVRNKTVKVSEKYNMSIAGVSSIIGMGRNPFTELYPSRQPDLIDAVYRFRKGQMDKAEQEGYQEAKEVYEQAITTKKKELKQLQQKIDGQTKEMMDIVSDAIDMFVEEKMKDADLNILL